MKTKAIILSALVLGLFAVQSRAATDEFTPRSDGFIRDWLLLAPIQLAADADSAEAVEKNQIPDEGLLKPKAGDKVTVRGKEFTWKKVKATDYFLDLNAICNAETEKTVAYAVAYIKADEEQKNLKLKMGSNDEGKVFLNGKLLLKATEPRALDQDSDTARDVTLNKGINVVVFKIINEGGSDWQGCLRFTDASDKPVTKIGIRLEP